MTESTPSFESELRISAGVAIVILIALSLVGLVLTDDLEDPVTLLHMQTFGLALIILLAGIWLAHRWRPLFGSWLMIVLLVAAVVLADVWRGVPGTLALLAIPTGMAAALISLSAATGTALGETLLVLLLRRALPPVPGWGAIGVALVAVWTTLGIMVAVYRPVYQVARWSWDYYQEAQGLLEEARSRKAALEQALADLVHANRQLALANDRLAGLRLVAEEAQKTKAVFVAKVSHEFRTPLNMIIGLTDLLVETPEVYGEAISPALLEDLKIVHRNCTHLSSLVDDVLALSQMESGQLALHREHVDLAEIIDRALVVVRPLVEKKGLGLQVDVPGDLPDIYCDRTRIRQVILNLVSNAARFTEEGGITVRVVQCDGRATVSVADTGPGVLPKDAERIFEPFCQGSDRLWRDRGGTGLGLSISRQFVRLHGGKIWLESEVGVGTTFYFDLPISAPIEHVVRPGHHIREDWIWTTERTAREKLPTHFSGPRVVICDETGDLYPVFARYAEGVEFVETRDVDQTADTVRECPAHAILVNSVLPAGLWPLVERMRLATPDTPVIGCAVPPLAQRGLNAGAVDYLIKPVTRADLQRAIQAVGRPVRRVLLVDDEPDLTRVLTYMLRSIDDAMEMVTAADGAQALLQLHNARYDLVLLDIMLPEMSGWQVLERMRLDETLCDVPCIIISACDPTDQPRASQALVAAMGQGLSLGKLLRCSLELSRLLLQPD